MCERAFFADIYWECLLSVIAVEILLGVCVWQYTRCFYVEVSIPFACCVRLALLLIFSLCHIPFRALSNNGQKGPCD